MNHRPELPSVNRRSLIFLAPALLALLLIPVPRAAAQDLFPELVPSPDYRPADVVGIQMQALGSNDIPFEDAGIELTWRFASPSNKAVTGPLERFKTLFSSPAYLPMINHVELEIGEATLVDGEALVPVLITDGSGNKAGYMFTLGQQTQQPFENCWMTTGVIRMTLPDGNATVM